MKELYTIGHSNHPIDKFLDLLKQQGITAIADVRSQPYSKYHPQFTYKSFKETLKKHDIAYVFLGNELGARTKDLTCYREGKVQFALLAQTKAFQDGIERLKKGIESYRVALMCAEKEPLDCHRMILITRALRADDLLVWHILADSSVETQFETERRLVDMLKISQQTTLSIEQQIELAYDEQSQKIAYCQKLAVQEDNEDYEQNSTVHDWLYEENRADVF